MKLPANSLTPYVLGLSLIAATAFPGIANADYTYQYTGNPFQVTYTQITQIDTGDFITVETLFNTFLNAEIRTSELLTAGSSLADVDTVRFYADFLYGTLDVTYPGPPPTPSDVDPTVGAFLNIGAVDSNGLPTLWNIGIDQYAFYGGRAHAFAMNTSNEQDSLTGYDEPFVFYSGTGLNQPGTWQLAVSPVPEPETYGMLLAGLGVLAGIARRKQSKAKG
jgi:hypothetical protein